MRGPLSVGCDNQLDAFHRHCYRVPAAEAKTGDAAFRTATLHFVQQGGQNPPAGIADSVSHRDRAAVDVDEIRIDTELFHDAQSLYGKRFVKLEKLDIG